ncbi:hypothetical protein [Spirosoma aerophilum]
MDKKVTTAAGIALGASLVAAAGYAIYKYFRKKSGNVVGNGFTGGSRPGNLWGGYVGNSLVKSSGLYESSALTRNGGLLNSQVA